MSGSVIESSEREECGGNPITRKEPTEKKGWGHVHLRGWGVRECEGYKTPKITVVGYRSYDSSLGSAEGMALVARS